MKKVGPVWIFCLLVLGFLLGSVTLISEKTEAATWTIENVDWIAGASPTGQYTSLVIDDNNLPHISYYDGTLKYARSTGVTWDIEVVDPSVSIGLYSSLTLDANGYPHISYFDSGNSDLKYASWNGTDWNIEIIDSAGNVGLHTSIALNNSGYPCISYYSNSRRELGYAWHDGSIWHLETADSTNGVGEWTSLALDDNDYPHISYYDSTNSNLRYTRKIGSLWTFDVVDSVDDVGSYTSLFLDNMSYPHISYYNSTNGDLKYAKWNGTDWNVETVDAAGNVGTFSSLALDNNGSAHISYYDITKANLKYAVETPGGWNIEPVDWEGDVGSHSSLSFNNDNFVHISYHDASTPALKYAKKGIGQDPPTTPSTPSGPTTGFAGTSYTYTTTSTDPDGDQIKITFDWGDGGTSQTDYMDSGSFATEPHSWTSPGFYFVRAKATDIGGISSEWSNSIIVTIFTTPSRPRNLIATPGDGEVNLEWLAPLDNGGSSITNYTIYRGTIQGGESFLISGGNILAHTDINLTNGVTYYYKVAAVNVAGEGPNSTGVNATPATPPSAPQNFQITIDNYQAVLTWDAPISDGGSPITNYRIYRGLVTGGEILLDTIGNTTTYTEIGLTPEVTFYYKVSAINNAGEGPQSGEQSVAIPSPPSLEGQTVVDESIWLLVTSLLIFFILFSVLLLLYILTQMKRMKKAQQEKTLGLDEDRLPKEKEKINLDKEMEKLEEEMEQLKEVSSK